jgi:hypothetical protein
MFIADRFLGRTPVIDGFTPEVDRHAAMNISPIGSVIDRRSSLILGEPGSGKSVALRNLHIDLAAAQKAEVALIDLKDHYSEKSVVAAFDDVALRPHLVNRDRFLLIDSLDEAPTMISRFVPFLRGYLQKLTTAGWRVIAACRSAEVVAGVTDLFDSLEHNAGYVLLPMRRSDASEVARASGVDPDAFLAELDLRRIEALAGIPFLLSILCKNFAENGSLGRNRAEVLESAVTTLMLENTGTDGPALRHAIPPIRARITAERMAAFSTLTGNNGLAVFRPGARAFGLATERILGSEPTNDGGEIQVTNDDAQSVLLTPLFADSGPMQRSFVHRSLRDHLTATWLHRRKLPAGQVQSVLTMSEGDTSIPPQMLDVATALLSVSSDYDFLARMDSLNLAKNGIALERPDLAPELVTSLLKTADITDLALSWQDSFRGIAYESLVEDLRDVLVKRDDSSAVVALRILKDSYTPGLEAELTDIVNDQTREWRVRKVAFEVLAQNNTIDPSAVDLFADGFFDLDPYSEIRGAVLWSLWPDAFSTAQALRILVRPPRNFFGMYETFLGHFQSSLTIEDSREIVRWHAEALRKLGSGEDVAQFMGHRLREIANEACFRMAPTLSIDDDRLNDMATIIMDRIGRYDQRVPVTRSTVPDDQWHAMLLALFKLTGPEEGAWHSVSFATDLSGLPLIDERDLDWIVERFNDEADARWARLLQFVVRPYEPAIFERLWGLKDKSIWPHIAHIYSPIALDSDGARQGRELQEMRRRRPARDTPDGLSLIEYLERTTQAARAVEKEPERFWELVRWLNVDAKFVSFNYPFPPDVLLSSSIGVVPAAIVDSIPRLALGYLRAYPKVAPTTISPNKSYLTVDAAYQALHTLERHESALLDNVVEVDWAQLVRAALEYRASYAGAEEVHAIRPAVLRRISETAPGEFRDEVAKYLRRCSHGSREGSAIADLAGVLDASDTELVGQALAGAASHIRPALFELLFELDSKRALAWARRQLTRTTRPAVIADALLGVLTQDGDSGARLLLQFLERDKHLIIPGLLEMAQRHRIEEVRWVELSEETRVSLFEKLNNVFPRAEDVTYEGVHSVTAREEIARLRESLLTSVARSGTSESIAAIRALSTRRTDIELLSYLQLAKESFRINGWSPLTLAELLGLINNARARLVRDRDSALELVLQELGHLQQWLIGETPQAFALWNVVDQARSPKNENTISDWYCHGLRERLGDTRLVVNREVEVKNLLGRGVGSRQDIRVELHDEVRDEQYVVVIEVKGSWNPEARSHLRTQLADTYLHGGNLTHGVFLVVHFPPDQVTDLNKRRAIQRNIRGLGQLLAEQAAEVAPDLIIAPLIHQAWPTAPTEFTGG